MNQVGPALSGGWHLLLAKFEATTFAIIFERWWWIMLIFVGIFLIADVLEMLIRSSGISIAGRLLAGAIGSYIFISLLDDLWLSRTTDLSHYIAPWWYLFGWTMGILVIIIVIESAIIVPIRMGISHLRATI